MARKLKNSYNGNSLKNVTTFCSLITLYLLVFPISISAQTITNIEIDPALDISVFAPYKIKAEISGSPISVTTQISVLNGDGSPDWDYYADGTPDSSTVEKTMTYDVGEGKYISENVYPDSIYPEIFFVSSDVTFNNSPLEASIRRGNYHLFHFENPFTITDENSFFIEFNAKPRSTTNSADLDVYLVRNNKPVSFFNSDWRSSADVELVGTFDKNATFHHTHNVATNSQHNLTPLMSNGNATFGLNNLDVNGDFWIVLYSDSPNVNRGWDLRYHPASNCPSINDRWYTGNRQSWATDAQNGCPDVHVHIARRDLVYFDQVSATVTATYEDDIITEETGVFSFATLPNLAPNPTSFITPLAGGVYEGNELSISWNPATDPNNDNLDYTIYVNDGLVTTTLVTATTSTSFNWDTTLVADGTYNLSGEVCDDNPTPLCTNFELPSSFVIERTLPTFSLDNVQIYSDNSVTSLAKAGDTIYLEFDSTGDISDTLLVEFYSGGNDVNGVVSYDSVGNSWIVSYVVDENDVDGSIDYVITADNLDLQYFNETEIAVDTTPPSNAVASPAPGTYEDSLEVTLSSIGSSVIRYSLTDNLESCSSGEEYLSPLVLLTSSTIKAIACDMAGNISNMVTLEYVIETGDSDNSGNGRPRILSNGSRPGATRIDVNKRIQNQKVFSHAGLPIELVRIINILISLKIIDDSKLGLLDEAFNSKFIFYRDLETGMEGDDVRQLQMFLNRNGFVLSSDGSGSPGSETNMFGALTRGSLVRFQQANNIIPAIGYFGPITRGVINGL